MARSKTKMMRRLAVELETIRLVPHYSLGWDAAGAARALAFARRWFSPHHDAIAKAARLLSSVTAAPDAGWFPGLYGPDTTAHAFGHRPNLFGFRALEPHYTTILGAFMQPGTVPRRIARARARVFIESVVAAARIDLPVEARPAPGAAVTVKSEARVAEGHSERLDLLFVWRAGGQPWALGIEVKFGGYKPSEGQLAAYDALIVRSAGGVTDRTCRVLLTTRAVDEGRRNGWAPLRWRTLLRHWETAITADGDADPTFASFRAALWQKALPE
ncbi:hypothetical protein [Rhodospira trueperi]|uniref:Uncharacterized protein n=1 Tax=Rhodospira trueperi TaxID=69960 RepID=A0A1G7HKF2_9PROT|nr:hypothetical protein [Rhodospira trueperi]SDF00925.1 hypothetical protein SAMN05421720_12218 [Rhodospira trueperi]